MANDPVNSTVGSQRCRNAVVAISALAVLAVALVLIRGFLLATGPSVLAALAAGIAVFIALNTFVCRATEANTRRMAREVPAAAPVTPRAKAEPVAKAVTHPLVTEPEVMAEPQVVSESDAAEESAVAPDPLPIVARPGPMDTAVVQRQMDKALMMGVAGTRAVHTDRRPSPADARRARAARVSSKSEAASRPAVKVAKSVAPTALVGLPKPAAMPTVKSIRPTQVSAAPTQAPPPAGDHPIAGGIDAAIARSHNASTVKTGDVVRLPRPRGGHADDLKLIKGVGPKLEALLNAAGIWHFDQIATWKARDIAEIDAAMKGFHGRITRDGWVKQARSFVAGATPTGKPRKPRAPKANS